MLLRAGHGRVGHVIPMVLLAGFYWFANHPYEGLRHDGWLYALMAAAWSDPGRYAGDLALQGGMQASATAFVPLYGMLFDALGIDLAARLVVFGGGLLWIAAAVMLSRQLLPAGWPAMLGALLLVTSGAHYSPNGITFALQENFATPRMLAMPLGLLGIAAGLGGRMGIAVALGVVATLLHPLNGIWPLCLLLASRLPVRLAVLLAPTFVAVLLLGYWVLPINGLLPIDGEWERAVRTSNPDAIPGATGEFRLGEYLFWITLLLLAGRLGTQVVRHLYLLLALIAAWATLLSLLSSLFSPVWLVLAVQPWRALWLAQALGLLAACDLLVRCFRIHRAGAVLCATCLMATWAGNEMRWLVPVAVLLLASLESGRQLTDRFIAAVDRRQKAAWATLMLAALFLAPSYLLDLAILGGGRVNPWWPDPDELRGFLMAGGGGAGVAVVAWIFHRHEARRWLSFVAGMLLGVSLLFWDGRAESQRKQEESWLLAKHPYPPQSGELVAWPGQSPRVWFEIGTGQYADAWQVSGLIFSRERMMEARRRLDRVAESDRQGGVRLLCADRILDWVVTRQLDSELAATEVDGLRFYSCKLVRQSNGVPEPT